MGTFTRTTAQIEEIHNTVNNPSSNESFTESIANEIIPKYTGVVYKASDGNSAVENMISGVPITVMVGDKCSTGGTEWERESDSNQNIDDFRPLCKVSALDFGVPVGGLIDASPKIAEFITYLQRDYQGRTQKVGYFPPRKYLLNGIDSSGDGYLNGILIPTINQTIDRVQNTVNIEAYGAEFIAGSSGMILLRNASSSNTWDGGYLNGNSESDVIGLGVVPQVMEDTSTAYSQQWNNLKFEEISDCTEGVMLRGGGGNSGCYYNIIAVNKLNKNMRHIWLRSPTQVGAPPPNRNTFLLNAILRGNTGIQIDSGDTNKFYSPSCELITEGTTPNSTPTAYILKTQGDLPTTWFNVGNSFISPVAEGCTKVWDTTYRVSHINGYYTTAAAGGIPDNTISQQSVAIAGTNNDPIYYKAESTAGSAQFGIEGNPDPHTFIKSPNTIGYKFRFESLDGTLWHDMDSGAFYVGGSSFGQGVTLNRSGSARFDIPGNNTVQTFVASDTLTGVGSIAITATNTSYNTSSDYRLKDVTGDYVEGKDVVMSLRPKRYNWKVNGEADYGLIAHEAQAVKPSSVSGAKDAETEDRVIIPQGVDYSKFVVDLIQHNQSIQRKLDEIEERLASASL